MGSRFDQSVRISTQAPSGIGPCSASQASMTSGVSSKSSSSAAPSEQSITTTGPTKFSGAISSTAPFGTSRPETQCTGASKCVPVCSFMVMLCHFHAGPRWS
jgi:hypothetical protein